jgi:hypothetical protein
MADLHLGLDATGRRETVDDLVALQLAADVAAPSSWRQLAGCELIMWQSRAILQRRWVEGGCPVGSREESDFFRGGCYPSVPLSCIRVTNFAGGLARGDVARLEKESAQLLLARGVPETAAAAATAWFKRVHGVSVEYWKVAWCRAPQLTPADRKAFENERQTRVVALQARLSVESPPP